MIVDDDDVDGIWGILFFVLVQCVIYESLVKKLIENLSREYFFCFCIVTRLDE